MSPFEMIKAHLGSSVPFAKHAGVKIIDVADGTGTATLEQTTTSINHINTQHAGALFTLGEAASGAALAGAFAPIIMGIRPVCVTVNIAYKKLAKGTITAKARTKITGADLLAEISSDGRVNFDIHVELFDSDNVLVAEMTVAWLVIKQ